MDSEVSCGWFVPSSGSRRRRGARERWRSPAATPRQELQNQLYPGVRFGLEGWQRSHSQGAGTGTESPDGILLAPSEVNLGYMNCGIEQFLRDLVRVKPANERLCLMTVTVAHAGTMRLASIQYQVTALDAAGRSATVLAASLTVENTRDDPKVSLSVDQLNLPDPMRQAMSTSTCSAAPE